MNLCYDASVYCEMMSVDEIRVRTILVATLLTRLEFSLELTSNRSPIRPDIRLGAPTAPVNGEHISLDFYNAYNHSEIAKDALQRTLHNFLENLQKNLTTSSVLQIQSSIKVQDSEKLDEQLEKIRNFANYLETISVKARAFIYESKHFFEATKNESNALLSKLRHVPTARLLPREVKLQLTSFFEEMEYLHVVFSEAIDEAMEFVKATVQATEQTFMELAERQQSILNYLNQDVPCCEKFMNFLLLISPDVLKCAAGFELSVAYDVFATAAITSKYILRQLEFRIIKLFNCFLFGNYEVRCKFIRDAEHDFDDLFDKIDELQIYYDLKTKKGRITKARLRDKKFEEDTGLNENLYKEKNTKACLEPNFPERLMPADLKECLSLKIVDSQYDT